MKVSALSILLDNAKLIVMYGLGAWIIGAVSMPLGLVYLAYCAASLGFYITVICPYCFRYHAGACLSGYHVFAALFKPQDTSRFAAQFRRYVGVLFPAWFAPPLAGLYALLTRFSWGLVAALALFCLVAFVILPYLSKEHSCKECENAPNCPWRKR